MAYHLHLFPKEAQGLEETVDLGVERHRSTEVVNVIEAVGRVAYLTTCIGIPAAPHLVGVHTVGKVDRGSDVDVIEKIESGRDWYTVLHAVTPVLDKAFFEKDILLGRQRVLQLAGIRKLDFFIPARGTDSFFALERIDLRHAYGNIGKRNRQRGVLSALGDIERCRQRPFALRKAVGHVYSRAFGILGERRRVIRVKVVARVAGSREIDR